MGKTPLTAQDIPIYLGARKESLVAGGDGKLYTGNGIIGNFAQGYFAAELLNRVKNFFYPF